MSRWDLAGPALCGLGALSMLVAALFVDLDSTAAKIFIAAAGILFVPGAIVTLATVRRRVGAPR
jgi:hypothetical protein